MMSLYRCPSVQCVGQSPIEAETAGSCPQCGSNLVPASNPAETQSETKAATQTSKVPDGLGAIHYTKITQTNYNNQGATTSDASEPSWFEIRPADTQGPNLLKCALQETAHYASGLKDKGMLLVTSSNREAATKAAMSVMDTVQRDAGLTPLSLTLTGYEATPITALIDDRTRIGESAPKRRDGGEGVVLLIDAYAEAGADRVRHGLPALQVSDMLRTHRVFLVILVPPSESWPGTLMKWTVDPINPWLQHRDLSPLAAEVDILRQKARGSAREDFESLVLRHLLSDSGELPDLVEEWKAQGFKQWLGATEMTDFPPSHCERCALFLGTFFEYLPYEQFSALMVKLTEGRHEPAKPAKVGETQQPPESSTTRWKDQSPSILRASGLRAENDETGQRIVRFSDPTVGVIHRSSGFPDEFLLESVKRLHELSVMLDVNTPPETAEALARTTAQLMMNYRSVFNDDWLMDVFVTALRLEAKRQQVRANAIESLDVHQMLKELLLKWDEEMDHEGQQQSAILFHRLKQLCLSIRDARITEKFINRVIEKYEPNGIISMKLLEPMNRGGSIAAMDYVKRTMTESNQRSVKAIWEWLCRECESRRSDEYSILQTVWSWIDGTKRSANLRLKSLCFLYSWAQEWASNWSGDQIGDKQRASAVFLERDWEERATFLLTWMTAPDFDESLTKVARWLDYTPRRWAEPAEGIGASSADLMILEMFDAWHQHPAHQPQVRQLLRTLSRTWFSSAPMRKANLTRVLDKAQAKLDLKINACRGQEKLPQRLRYNARKEQLSPLQAAIA